MIDKFRASLPSEWVKYVVVLILSVALWVWAFGMFHAPSDIEKIEVFFAGEVKNYSFEKDAADAFDSLKSVQLRAVSPQMGTSFNQKYTMVGLASSDVVIVPESVAEKTDCASVFLPLQGFGESFCQGEGENTVAYGVYLSDAVIARLSPYFVFEEGRYVVFAVASSVNAGKITDHSIRFIEWLVG